METPSQLDERLICNCVLRSDLTHCLYTSSVLMK